MFSPKTCATQYHAQLGLPDKGRAIKGLVVCNSWDLEPWDLLNGLALGCYQPSLRYDSYVGPKSLDPNIRQRFVTLCLILLGINMNCIVVILKFIQFYIINTCLYIYFEQ